MWQSVSIADVEAYWDRQPCNVRHGTAPEGTEKWSAQVTARKYKVEPHIPGFAQFARWRGKTVLEIGCGIGTDTLEFAKAGARVYALDISRRSIELARTRLPMHGKWELGLDDQISWFCVDAEKWVPPVWYDLIYSFGVLHHTPSPTAVLERAFKWLRPGGELRIMLYARWSLKWLTREQPEAQAGCPIVEWYTAEHARDLLGVMGFEVLSIQKTHIFPYQVEAYKRHEYVKRWQYRYLPASVFSRLERLLGHHLLIVARKPHEHR